jgi:hypothetical protein
MKQERTGGNVIRVLVAAICASLALGACSSSRPDYDVADGARGPDGKTEQMRRSTDDNNDWGDAVTAPLEDLNLRRTHIPQILLDSMSRPYDLAGMDKCEAISSEVRKLDALLGPDLDEPPPPADESSMREKGGRMANKAAVGAVRRASRSIIPFRGLIRDLTGAEKHSKLVDEAIQAGKSRRAYLKGVGMNKNCAPPAAPSWFQPRVYIDTYEKAPAQTTSTKKKRPTSRRGGRR